MESDHMPEEGEWRQSHGEMKDSGKKRANSREGAELPKRR